MTELPPEVPQLPTECVKTPTPNGFRVLSEAGSDLESLFIERNVKKFTGNESIGTSLPTASPEIVKIDSLAVQLSVSFDDVEDTKPLSLMKDSKSEPIDSVKKTEVIEEHYQTSYKENQPPKETSPAMTEEKSIEKDETPKIQPQVVHLTIPDHNQEATLPLSKTHRFAILGDEPSSVEVRQVTHRSHPSAFATLPSVQGSNADDTVSIQYLHATKYLRDYEFNHREPPFLGNVDDTTEAELLDEAETLDVEKPDIVSEDTVDQDAQPTSRDVPVVVEESFEDNQQESMSMDPNPVPENVDETAPVQEAEESGEPDEGARDDVDVQDIETEPSATVESTNVGLEAAKDETEDQELSTPIVEDSSDAEQKMEATDESQATNDISDFVEAEPPVSTENFDAQEDTVECTDNGEVTGESQAAKDIQEVPNKHEAIETVEVEVEPPVATADSHGTEVDINHTNNHEDSRETTKSIAIVENLDLQSPDATGESTDEVLADNDVVESEDVEQASSWRVDSENHSKDDSESPITEMHFSPLDSGVPVLVQDLDDTREMPEKSENTDDAGRSSVSPQPVSNKGDRRIDPKSLNTDGAESMSLPRIVTPKEYDPSKPSWSSIAKSAAPRKVTPTSTPIRPQKRASTPPTVTTIASVPSHEESSPPAVVKDLLIIPRVTDGKGLESRSLTEAEASGPFVKVDKKFRPRRAVDHKDGLLVLFSSLSIVPEVVATQDKVFRALDDNNIDYWKLDGADSANKDLRNKLFGISGLRAAYPQFFFVNKGEYDFWGDEASFQKLVSNRSVAKTFPTKERAEEQTKVPVEKTKAPQPSSTKASQPSSNSPPAASKSNTSVSHDVLILVSNQSLDHRVKSNQERMYSILSARKIPHTLCDGADPKNKDRRNALFSISGLRAQYPQVFVVENGSTEYWGDWERFEESNEAGTLKSDLLERGSQIQVTKTSGENEATHAGSSKTPTAAPATKSTGESSSGRPPKPSKTGKHRGTKVDTNADKKTSEAMLDDDGTVDITIFGATSFVARHVILYLLQSSLSLDRTLKITLAGRNPKKLEVLEDQWSKKSENLLTIYPDSTGSCKFDRFVAESSDKGAIKVMVRRSKVVLSCAGPFSKYSTNVVAACAESGIDYVDITGEVHWVAEMRQKFGPMASKSGCRIIPMCGFDSVPSDIGVYLATKLLKKGKPGAMVDTATTWHYVFGMANGGTIHTALDMPMTLREDFSHWPPFLMDDPLALVHPNQRNDPSMRATRKRLASAEWWNQLPMAHTIFLLGVSGPFFMAPINAKVVHASAVALKYGKNFRYYERFLPVGYEFTSRLGLISIIPALLTQLIIYLVFMILKLPFIGKKIAHAVSPPGSGVPDEVANAGFAQVYVEVQSAPNSDGRVDRANCFLDFVGDPGNIATAQCVGESALCLCLDKDKLPPRSADGFGTPAELLGDVLLDRLLKNKVRPLTLETNVRRSAAAFEWKMYP